MIMSFEDLSKLISELCVALYKKMMRILIHRYKCESRTFVMAQEFLDAKQILERAVKAEGIESNLATSRWSTRSLCLGLAKIGNLSTPDSPCPEYFFGLLTSLSAE